ncbi:MAG: glutamine-hydrolyzing carbamoyl-phosphate synthase small subunit [Rhodospirillales bacterium]|nr:glutamine-hydrolyzing carbamoyl-phosphate synthase small subunit [Rhodospirillales bacterium]
MGAGYAAPVIQCVETPSAPPQADAALVLEDGSVYWGRGVGAVGVAIGEVCFNTSVTGYQEILTDPSYAGQIITFTFPHIGNVGTNAEDAEASTPAARGCILRMPITEPSNWRATLPLHAWLRSHNLVAIADVDTRRLTRRIRDGGAPRGALIHCPGETIDTLALRFMAEHWPGLEGMDLAKEVMCRQTYQWDEPRWTRGGGDASVDKPRWHVVAVDFGAKRNILRCLASAGCRVTVVPGTASMEEVLRHQPDGVFLSNGPGDPAATGEYAVPMIQGLLARRVPLFGICLGHQLLGLALGARTYKLHLGHRGANHPVKDLETGKVEITSQNHGFAVDRGSLPQGVIETHVSLFDKTNEGLRLDGAPAFSVQYHPEASPGPQDSHYLFDRFTDLMRRAAPSAVSVA